MSCDSYDEYGHPHNDGDPGCLCTDCAHDTLQRARFLEAENSRLKAQLVQANNQLIRANDDANKYCREAKRFFDQVLALTQERDEARRTAIPRQSGQRIGQSLFNLMRQAKPFVSNETFHQYLFYIEDKDMIQIFDAARTQKQSEEGNNSPGTKDLG